ncbi:HAD family hydrolase [Paenibacillus sp. J2TS4]|uniref:HAD family hydrolase n=1 Tax=Paenibacillus sp. J2TS4 TaxID=2807194 RepID=UPI001B1B6D8D|nr:Cof-type HAD-IIB family hydrolase [Paenibacillus sp. J2TS4]GIP31160.1 5-amino-6-(5-phospho-D-ribitylamino)uracil phosphatase YcsE [Paenibacillus sp. J2TS4]
MGKYKLIALDMDGTFLTNEQTISEENRKWVHKAIDAGVTVMFSTGRGVQNIFPYVEDLGLQSPLVAVNGSEVWKSPDELLKRHVMEMEWIRQLYQMALDYDVWYWGYSVGGLYNKDKWAAKPEEEQWLKFGVFTEDHVKLKEIRSRLEDWGVLEITNSHVSNLELNPLGISKASGIMEVCNLLGLKMEEVIGMGDSLNDLQMIHQVGLGVAMENAQEELKKAADVITDTNQADGVAKAIQKYVFGL